MLQKDQLRLRSMPQHRHGVTETFQFAPLRGFLRPRCSAVVFLASIFVLLSNPQRGALVSATDDDFYSETFDDDLYQKYASKYGDDATSSSNATNDDNKYQANSNYDYADDDTYDPYSRWNDDVSEETSSGADYYNDTAKDDDKADDYYTNAYKSETTTYRKDTDDDRFYWAANVGFDGVSVMPLSCINYNNGHMIKFQLFDSANSYQCHFAEISTFVVSIAHYMRAYFNYQALVEGKSFSLPKDAGYLNCVALSQNSGRGGQILYGKIGCMERETFTSTKLQLHVYKDSQCSQLYDDGQGAKKNARRGYMVHGKLVSPKVSFNPPFYSCLTCAPGDISGTFNKKNSNWYDDDYISSNGKKQQNYNNNQNAQAATDDGSSYLSANDDVGNDDAAAAKSDDKTTSSSSSSSSYQYYNNNRQYSNGGYSGGSSSSSYNQNGYSNYNRGYNNYGYNNYGNRKLISAVEAASPEALQAYHDEFWQEINSIKMERSLYDNYYDIGKWNMCQRIYKYGLWCNEECRALDFFRTDMWSGSDVFLLSVMSVFLTAMMLLVVAKRLKAQSRQKIYGEDQPLPGLPPLGMAIIFVVTMAVIVTLAKLKFINETLVFSVVTCILLFIYMLKLTLFENRRPVLLAAPRHDMFDNPLDDHLFD